MPIVSAGSGTTQVATLTLTSAQLKAAQAAFAYQIVAAPGPGLTILPLALACKLHFGTIAYLNGSGLDFGLASGGDLTNNVVWQATNTPVNAAGDTVFIAGGGNTGNQFTANTYENVRFAVTLGGAAYTAGDGTLGIAVAYSVVAL
jgi:hypothetical protein